MPSSEANSHGERTCILYARASTDDQEYSVPGQLRELAAHAESAGLRVVAQVKDRGEKRHTLDRPGIEEMRELCATGEIDEVWAWAWDRYGEFPMPEVLALDLEEFGTKLRSLDDGGGGESSYEMNVIRSLFSRREQKSRVARSRRGRSDKALRGEVFGGFRARYGFRFVRGRNQRGREVTVGYEVEPEKMTHVRRILGMVASGYGPRGVQRELEQAGIPNPSGGRQWSTDTIRKIVRDDIYKPHSHEEVASMVAPGVAATLEPERVYGIFWHGRKRSRFKNSRSKVRETYETPPEEWTAVPVDLTGSGLDRATVETARDRIKDNRASSKSGDRFWTLSGGLLRCAECGRAMIAYSRRNKNGRSYFYRCRPSTSLAVCSNRKSHRAEDLEHSAWEILSRAISHKDEVLHSFEAAVAQYRQPDSEAHIASLTKMLAGLERKRDGYWDLAASGDMPKDVMRAKVAEIEEQIAAIREELAASRDASEREAAIEQARQIVMSMPDGPWIAEIWHPPEEQRERYKALGLRLEVDRDSNLTESWGVAIERNVTTLRPPSPGARLEPVHVLPVERRLIQLDYAPYDQVRRDRGPP